MRNRDLAALLNLLHTPGLGPHKVRRLVDAHAEPEGIFSLSTEKLCRVEGIDIKSAQAIQRYREPDFGLQEVQRAGREKAVLVTLWDPEYPLLLKKIYNPPPVLYLKGQPLKAREDCLAVVGTRTMTAYGKSVTQQLVRDLAAMGLVIVSGLARGVDTVGHRETVHQGGRTIAVLGSGIDVIYPAENRRLFEAICEQGTVCSEFPLGAKPDAGNFPQRNRIISGFSHATLVIEAGDRSGAILTALNAIDQNRLVFALPGRINDRKSRGCLRLIRNGAVPLDSARQVLDQIHPQLFEPLQARQEPLRLDLTGQERAVLGLLSNDPRHIDDLLDDSDLDLTRLLMVLLELELKGAVRQLSGKQFVLA